MYNTVAIKSPHPTTEVTPPATVTFDVKTPHAKADAGNTITSWKGVVNIDEASEEEMSPSPNT